MDVYGTTLDKNGPWSLSLNSDVDPGSIEIY